MYLLEWDYIKEFDFKKTKLAVELVIDKIIKSYYKCASIIPKSLTSRLQFVKVDGGDFNHSPVEDFVIYKSEAEEKYAADLKRLADTIDSFTQEESNYFKAYYFSGYSEASLLEPLHTSKNGLDHIKKSAIIKFALAYGIDRKIN